MPTTFELTLGLAYYNKGFFNVPKAHSDKIADESSEVIVYLGEGGRRATGRVDRSANASGAPRIHSGKELSIWLQAQFALGDIVMISIIDSCILRIHEERIGRKSEEWIVDKFQQAERGGEQKRDDMSEPGVGGGGVDDRRFNLPNPDVYLESADVDWTRVICESSYWISPEAFRTITVNNWASDGPGVFFPFCIRMQKMKKTIWKDIEGGHRFLDLNHKPQEAIFRTFAGKGWGSGCGYTCCHIYGKELISTSDAGWKNFTCVGNIVLVPQPLKALTDHYAPVMECLRYISYKNYNWAPDGVGSVESLGDQFGKYVSNINLLPVVRNFQSVYVERLRRYAGQCNPINDVEVARWKDRVLKAK